MVSRPKPKQKHPVKKKKTKKKNSEKLQLVKILLGLLVLIVLVLLAGLLMRYLLLKRHPLDLVKHYPVLQRSGIKKPTFEIYPTTDTPSEKQKQAPVEPFTGALPKIALIIDDIGYDSGIVKDFIRLETPLTLSILPQIPQKQRILDLAQSAGLDIMLHQPMEPIEYPKINPGPGTLFSAMSPDERIRVLSQNLDEIPNVKGVNNHMGSRMTANSEQMRQILSVLKQRDLFFVDSRTTAATICRMSAELLQVPFGERDVFLDHRQNHDFIEKQMRELVRLARAHGEAIGIAHPHASTYRVLKRLIPELKTSVAFVPVSTLVKPSG